MQPRVAYVSPIAPGCESQVREAHDRFPQAVLNEIGAAGVTAFIGNGYYVIVFALGEGDFQEQFSRFTGDPATRRFFDDLGPYLLEPLPLDVHPSDGFHAGSTAPAGAGTTTARLPLVGEIFHWEMLH